MQPVCVVRDAAAASAASQPREVRRAAEWRPEPVKLANANRETVIRRIQMLLTMENEELLRGGLSQSKWKDYLSRAYEQFHARGQKGVSLEMAIYAGLKKLCWDQSQSFHLPREHFDANNQIVKPMTDEIWASHGLNPPKGTRKDEGYVDWLEKERPDFYFQYASEICRPIPVPLPNLKTEDPKAKEAEKTVPFAGNDAINGNTSLVRPQPIKKDPATPQEVPPNGPLNRFQEVALATATARETMFKQGFPQGLPPSIAQDSHFKRFEVQIPNNINHDRCYRAHMKEAQALLPQGICITWIGYGTKYFFVLHLAEGYDFSPLRSAFAIVFSRLTTYCCQLAGSKYSIILPEFLENADQSAFVKSLQQTAETFKLARQVPTTSCEKRPLPAGLQGGPEREMGSDRKRMKTVAVKQEHIA
ncbi:hypothetical protein CSOJ01_07394 [Colletotrichum sojae]|uniref:Uncharacterized protein n=1 Tax=Colletotrichum sojae TaxID=2175907 RepID=A0A8H6J911_9PEZI|nr:hypothetical protein CSOJ01_07394 [Colletotrichum sojae]